MAIFTVVEKVYWQEPNDDALCIESVFTSDLNEEDEPYQRNLTIQDKTKIDVGWLGENPGWCVIKNKGEEMLTLAYEHDGRGFLIPPGSSMRFYPESYQGLQLSSSKPTKITLAVFPQ